MVTMWIVGMMGGTAIWVFFNAHDRGDSGLAWALGSFLLAPVVLPLYFAYRTLKPGERREGGRAWSVLKNLSLAWTATMALAAGAAVLRMADVVNGETSDAGMAGAGLGAMMGLGAMGAIWLVPMLVALVLGAFLKTSEVETG